MKAVLASGIFPRMEALGPILIVLAVPFLFRWVPRNRVFGFRIAATLRNDSVWYDVNALCASAFQVVTP